MPTSYRNKHTKALCRALMAVENEAEALAFLRDLLTLQEIETFAQRYQMATMLHQGRHFVEIEKETGASSATIARVNKFLKHGNKGYLTILKRLESNQHQRNT